MADIADDVKSILSGVDALATAVTALTTAVSAISAPTVDFTPVLAAIAGVAAQLQPTPVAAPVEAAPAA